MISSRRVLPGLLLLATLLAAAVRAQGPPPPLTVGGVTEFRSGITIHNGALVLATDKTGFWYDGQFDDKIGFFSFATGSAEEWSTPPGTAPHNMIMGPDGNLWFAGLTDNIGTFNVVTKETTVFRDGISPNSEPHVLAVDPRDANFIWCSEEDGGRMARIDRTTKEIVEFNIGPGSGPHGVIPDTERQALWLCVQGRNALAKIDVSSHITTQGQFDAAYEEFPGLPPGGGPHDPIFGPDGRIYISLEGSNQLARFDIPSRTYKIYDTTLSPFTRGLEMQTLHIGPDNNSIWFNQFVTGRVAKLDLTTQQITEYKVGISPFAGPLWMILGPDNNMWFSEVSLLLAPFNVPGAIARIVESEAQPALEPNRGFIETLYADLLHRQADPAGIQYFTGLLRDRRANHFQESLAMLSSREARTAAVQREYLTLLQRPADPGGLEFFVRMLQRGEPIGAVRTLILGSPEYFRNRGGSSNAGFFNALYQDVLGRGPLPGEEILFNAALVAKGRKLGEPLPIRGPVVAAPRRVKDPTGLGFDREPQRQPSSFNEAVRAVRKKRLQRRVVTAEQLRLSLDSGASRNSVAGALVFSRQRAILEVEGLYGRFFSLAAEPVALDVFSDALLRGASPDVVTAAITGSDEYRLIKVFGKPLIPPGGIPE